MRILCLAAALLSAGTIVGCAKPAAQTANADEADKTGNVVALAPVTIRTASGDRLFRVEVARTEREQERGLMYRTSLADDGGMLFPSDLPAPRSFWMKNTVISLDLIFIRADGRIAKIAEETVPNSTDHIVCAEPVIAVLEIGGGRSAALGIAEGDRVDWPGGPLPK